MGLMGVQGKRASLRLTFEFFGLVVLPIVLDGREFSTVMCPGKFLSQPDVADGASY
jgi:hypothetical protein